MKSSEFSKCENNICDFLFLLLHLYGNIIQSGEKLQRFHLHSLVIWWQVYLTMLAIISLIEYAHPFFRMSADLPIYLICLKC